MCKTFFYINHQKKKKKNKKKKKKKTLFSQMLQPLLWMDQDIMETRQAQDLCPPAGSQT